jgi:hypothetical protein
LGAVGKIEGEGKKKVMILFFSWQNKNNKISSQLD